MFLEEFAVGAGVGTQLPVDQAGHDLTEYRRVTFRLGLAVAALDTESCELLAQPRERTLKQKSRLIIRAVGQQFPAPEPDKEVEVLALGALRGCAAGGFRKRSMRDAE